MRREQLRRNGGVEGEEEEENGGTTCLTRSRIRRPARTKTEGVECDTDARSNIFLVN